MLRKVSGTGLAINDRAVRLVKLIRIRNCCRLLACGEAPVPEGAIEKGAVVDMDAVAAAVREVFVKTGVKTRKVVTAVSGQQAYIRTFSLPPLRPRELKRAAYFQAVASLPVSPEEVVMDTITGPRLPGAQQVELLVVAVRRQVVENLVKALRLAGVEPEAVEIEPFSLYRLFQPNDAKGLLIADIGLAGIQFSFFENGWIRSTRSVAMVEKKLYPTWQQGGDEIISAKDLPGVPFGNSFIKQIATQIDKTVEYYRLRHTGPEIDTILLTGEGAQVEGLSKFLQARFSARVAVGDLPSWVELPPGYREGQAGCLKYTYGAAVGLAAREVMR